MMKSLARTLENLFVVALILFTLLAISGVNIYQSTRFALVSGFICASGGQLWTIISKKHNLSTFEFIGMGLAFGSLSASFLQIALRTTALGSIAWVLVGIFIPIGMKIDSNRNFHNSKILNFQLEGPPLALKLSDLLAVTAFALAALWWWIYPFAITLTISSICARLYLQKKSKSTFQILILSFFLLAPAYVWCTNLRERNDLWKITSHDQVFSESLAWSLNSFGRSESPFLVGTEVNYHWLALHWAGLLTQASNGASWISITRLIPILSYLGIFCLLITLSSKFGKRTLNIFATAIPFLFLSNTFGLDLGRYIVSPSFQFTCIWMLATLIILLTYFEDYSLLKLASIGLMSFASFGGKLMNGFVVLGGLAIVLLFQFKNHRFRNSKNLLIVFLVLVFSTAAAYAYFFRSNAIANTNTLKIGIEIGGAVGIVRPDSRFLIQLFAAVIFNLMITLPMILAATYIYQIRKEKDTGIILLVGSIVVGILATTLTVHEGVSQLYFLLASMVICMSIYPIVFAAFAFETSVYWKVIPGSAIVGVVSQILWSYSNESTDYHSSVYIKLIVACIYPLIILIYWLRRGVKDSFGRPLIRILVPIVCLSILVSSISVGVFRRIEKLPTASRQIPVNIEDPSRITGSSGHLSILNWLRTNTPKTDIVAINRFCIPGVETCIMKWQLVSAISQRRVLIEGGYGDPMKLQPGEIQDRFDYSSHFAASPDEINLNHLCNKGVKWFFYDPFGITPRINWAPFASVQLSNDSASLLKLNCTMSS
jgi:hypothetical protein